MRNGLRILLESLLQHYMLPISILKAGLSQHIRIRYFLHILPTIGGAVSGNKSAYIYLPASVLNFPGPDKFIPMMTAAGFRDVRHTAFTFGICRMYVGVK